MTRTSHGQDAYVDPAEEPVEVFQLASDLPLGDPLQVEVQPGPHGTCTLQLIGEIDLATAPLFRSRVMDQLERAPQALVLDLQQVGFLGSSGLAVLIEIRAEAIRRSIGLQLVATSQAVLRALTATGLIELFDVSSG